MLPFNRKNVFNRYFLEKDGQTVGVVIGMTDGSTIALIGSDFTDEVKRLLEPKEWRVQIRVREWTPELEPLRELYPDGIYTTRAYATPAASESDADQVRRDIVKQYFGAVAVEEISLIKLDS